MKVGENFKSKVKEEIFAWDKIKMAMFLKKGLLEGKKIIDKV